MGTLEKPKKLQPQHKNLFSQEGKMYPIKALKCFKAINLEKKGFLVFVDLCLFWINFSQFLTYIFLTNFVPLVPFWSI